MPDKENNNLLAGIVALKIDKDWIILRYNLSNHKFEEDKMVHMRPLVDDGMTGGGPIYAPPTTKSLFIWKVTCANCG